MINYNKIKFYLISVPIPSSISYIWNFGSILIIRFFTQIFTGLILIIFYTPLASKAFNRIFYLIREPFIGWLIRLIHCNIASIYFLILLIHLRRRLYFKYIFSYRWFRGTIIYILSIITAFLGYVLPWGQISYWAAIVITNLLTAIPYIGERILIWLWGNFSITFFTLTRFYIFHFIVPIIIIIFLLIHINNLHLNRSSNPLGLNNNDFINFHPYYTWKDLLGFIIIFILLIKIICLIPFFLINPENFNIANSLLTPSKIEPEWYFLYTYSILRSIPNKLGGFIAIISSFILLLILPYLYNTKNLINIKFFPFNNIIIIIFFINYISLRITGFLPIKDTYIFFSQIFTFLYFIFFLIDPIIIKIWYKNL